MSAPFASAAGAAAAEPVRIMPLGDSITDGCRACTSSVPGAYRTRLARLAAADGLAVDFVGSRRNGPPALPDRDHEGHPGYRIDQLLAGVDRWVTAARPDVVLVHAGTNDLLQGRAVATAPERLRALTVRIGDLAPEADVFVATLFPSSHPLIGARIRQFNLAVPRIVAELAAQGRRVHLVPIGSFTTTSHLGRGDQVHPSAWGHAVMAVAWYAAMRTARALPGPDGTREQPQQREVAGGAV